MISITEANGLKYFYRFLIELTNYLPISKIIKTFTTSKWSKPLISSYAKTYNINLQEAEKTIDQYETLHDFFTRKLKKETRSLELRDELITSPVDGLVLESGTIEEELFLNVKGHNYSVEEMLLNENGVHKKYLGGTFVVLYLSPSDYHRIHSPVSGVVTKQWSNGKKSYPVNEYGLKYGSRTLASNYRIITELKNTHNNHTAVVKVGALFINSVELTHKNEYIEQGEEMAYFSFGSTVVLLFEKGMFNPDKNINGKKVKVGDSLGEVKTFE